MRILRTLVALTFGFFLFITGISAHNKERGSAGLIIHYTLKADIADLSGYDIEIHLHNARPHFQLAMATHHEYDDRFWRFVKNFRVESPDGKSNYTRKDSALWDITIPGNDV